MTIAEAAKRLGKSESALRRAIKAGKLRAELIDGKYDITEEALNAYAPPTRKEGAPTRDIEELERLRMENETLRRELENVKSKLDEKDEDLRRKDEQLADASQRHDTIVLQLTRQIEQSQRLLEHHQEPWYRRWFRKGKRNESHS